MTGAISESVKPRVSPRSSRKKTSQVNGMLVHMSMHSVSLLLEAILLKAKSFESLGRVTDAAEECRTIIDIVESAWPNVVPQGTSEECKLIDMFHSSLEYLPNLWMRIGCFEEAIIAYRRALARPWNLDSQRKMILQDDALRLLQDATAMAKYSPEILYSLAWENAMQRKLNAAINSAMECLELASGSSNLQEAEALVDLALDDAEEEDQMCILRLKAQIQAPADKSLLWNLLGVCLQSFKQRRKSGNRPHMIRLHPYISWRWKLGWIWHQYTQSLKRGVTQTSVLTKPNPSIFCIQSAGMLKALYWRLSPCIKAAYKLRELSPIQDFSEQLPILLH